MKPAAQFWDRIAEKYSRSPVSNPDAWDRTLDRTRAHLPEGARALELGCGTGSSALRLADAVATLAATDVSGEMIAIARRKAAEAGCANVTFEQVGPDGPPVSDGPYDAVLAFNLLHLVDDLPALLTRVHGLLRPGGVFVSKSACLKGKRVVRLAIPVMQLFGRAPHVAFFSAAELEAAIAAAGFEILETADLPPPARLVVARKPG